MKKYKNKYIRIYEISYDDKLKKNINKNMHKILLDKIKDNSMTHIHFTDFKISRGYRTYIIIHSSNKNKVNLNTMYLKSIMNCNKIINNRLINLILSLENLD